MSYYTGNQTGQIPGKIPDTWWEGGAMFMTLFQYWHWTGDNSYNEVTKQGMLWQAGAQADYMPANWSRYLVCYPSSVSLRMRSLILCRETMIKSSGVSLP
jgi:hypothetical protein